MRILLDHCLDWRLKRLLPGHDVTATFELGWQAVKNGRLPTLAQVQFDVFLTALLHKSASASNTSELSDHRRRWGAGIYATTPFLTVDRGIKYQQNLKGRPIAVITLRAKDNRLATHAPLMP